MSCDNPAVWVTGLAAVHCFRYLLAAPAGTPARPNVADSILLDTTASFSICALLLPPGRTRSDATIDAVRAHAGLSAVMGVPALLNTQQHYRIPIGLLSVRAGLPGPALPFPESDGGDYRATLQESFLFQTIHLFLSIVVTYRRLKQLCVCHQMI